MLPHPLKEIASPEVDNDPIRAPSQAGVEESYSTWHKRVFEDSSLPPSTDLGAAERRMNRPYRSSLGDSVPVSHMEPNRPDLDQLASESFPGRNFYHYTGDGLSIQRDLEHMGYYTPETVPSSSTRNASLGGFIAPIYAFNRQLAEFDDYQPYPPPSSPQNEDHHSSASTGTRSMGRQILLEPWESSSEGNSTYPDHPRENVRPTARPYRSTTVHRHVYPSFNMFPDMIPTATEPSVGSYPQGYHQIPYASTSYKHPDHSMRSISPSPQAASSVDSESGRVEQCPDCDQKFTGLWAPRNLSRHVENKHVRTTSRQNHLCEVCGKSYQRKDALLMHSRKTHPDIASVPARRKRLAIPSLRSKDLAHSIEGQNNSSEPQDDSTNQTEYACPEPGCDRHFNMRADLLRHQRIHQTKDERPHKCTTCGESFLYPKDLSRHAKTHETQTPSMLHCPVKGCSNADGFSRRDNLLRHIRKQHPDQSSLHDV